MTILTDQEDEEFYTLSSTETKERLSKYWKDAQRLYWECVSKIIRKGDRLCVPECTCKSDPIFLLAIALRRISEGTKSEPKKATSDWIKDENA